MGSGARVRTLITLMAVLASNVLYAERVTVEWPNASVDLGDAYDAYTFNWLGRCVPSTTVPANTSGPMSVSFKLKEVREKNELRTFLSETFDASGTAVTSYGTYSASQ